MITINPFIEMTSFIPPIVMQIYIVAMFLMVVGGTILDMVHKKSAQYFFANSENDKKSATRQVSGGEKVGIAVKTVTSEVLTSAEFQNPKRRISHLFTMYGFILFVASTAIMIFAYPTAETVTPTVLPIMWHIGAAMLCFGGYWFWFFIRVDLFAEAKPWYKLARADIFIVTLLTTATFGLIWSTLQANTDTSGVWTFLFFAFFIVSSTTLFSTVLWSKFAHMFFKPAAAFQKRVTKADGSRENLPELADRNNPADRDRHSMELLKDAPLDMGLGIKREAPQHY